jgi:hypothetical protein
MTNASTRLATARATWSTRRTVIAVALLAALVASIFVLRPSNAEATTINYSGTTSGTQSTITIHRGDQYQRILHPEGTVTATLDDTNKKVLNGAVTLKPSYTETFVGPFNLVLYARTDLEQIGSVSGTATPSATEGVADLTVNATNRLHLTVYIQAGATQQPATDQKLTDPNKCHVDLALSLKGQANRRTGAMSVAADPFTIPAFPADDPANPNLTCGFGTGALNQQVAGANNAISLNFTGGPTTAHYTGVSKGTQSTIVIKKGDLIFEKTVHPTGSIEADIDFAANKITNTKTVFNPVDVPALPGVLAALPVNAHIEITTLGPPTASLAPSGTPGIDNAKVAVKARMAVTATAITSSLKLTNPKTCYVDLSLDLSGTVDRGTDALKLSQPKFTVPSFPFFGCGLLGPALTAMVSGKSNSINLNFVDGVIPTP